MFRAGALRPCPPHHAPCAAHHRGRSQLETGRARPLCSAGPALARSLQAARHPGQSREEDKTCLHGLIRGPLGQHPARAHLPEPLASRVQPVVGFLGRRQGVRRQTGIGCYCCCSGCASGSTLRTGRFPAVHSLWLLSAVCGRASLYLPRQGLEPPPTAQRSPVPS